jgi:beta-xylosidase
MVEAVMLWNEPNNLSHWNFHLDPGWELFAKMVREASAAIHKIRPHLKVVLGGVSSCDAAFIQLMESLGALENVDVVAIHGFPLDWNHWSIHEWPDRIREARATTFKPVWVSEVGASSFGAEEVQVFGLHRMAKLLAESEVERVHWYSLFDLPPTWEATTRHKEAEGSAYYRHYYMGLLKHDGTPKLALRKFPRLERFGICQWFHFEDQRLEAAKEWMRHLGVRYLRTGVSWADYFRPGAEAWFDKQMTALEEFETTMTLCFTPEHLGIEPHWTSPPVDVGRFTEFACWAVARYVRSEDIATSCVGRSEEVVFDQ